MPTISRPFALSLQPHACRCAGIFSSTGRRIPLVPRAEIMKRDKSTSAKEAGASAASKKKKITKPVTGNDGWTIHPPSLIYKQGEAKSSSMIAGFDLDSTLVTTKSGMDIARNENDWKLFNAVVPEKIQECVENGYKVVIFSNQNAIKSALDGKMAEKTKKRIDAVLNKVSVPAQAFLATQKDGLRKPESGMWNFMSEHCNGGVEIDLKKSFYVGDMAGRPADRADSDRKFAENLGITFHTPEAYFGSCTTAADGPNGKAVSVLQEMALLLKEKGDFFKGNALAKAAAAIQDHGQELTTAKEAQKLPGVGKSSGGILEEVVKTGTCAALQELKGEVSGTEAGKPPDGSEKGKTTTKATKQAKSNAFKFV